MYPCVCLDLRIFLFHFSVVEECTAAGHTVVSDYWRSSSFANSQEPNRRDLVCDILGHFAHNGLMEGWFRFQPPAGLIIPTVCTPFVHCLTGATVWMNGSLPSIEDGVVTRPLCASYPNDCCAEGHGGTIEVRKCPGNFFVYQHTTRSIRSNGCATAYCAAGKISFSRSVTVMALHQLFFVSAACTYVFGTTCKSHSRIVC